MVGATTVKSGGATPRADFESVTVRFAGDSGDGMQLVGTQFTNTSSIFGNDVATLPDFPAEIRAPAGSLAGVSGFQLNFASRDIHTPGDSVDALIAMNPAALRMNYRDVAAGGLIVTNSDAFNAGNLQKAGLQTNPVEDGTLKGYRVYAVPMEKLTAEAAGGLGLGTKAVNRCKNFFALGIICWLYERPLEPILRWIEQKMGKAPALADANSACLKAGYNYCDTVELFPLAYRVPKAHIAPGTYRKITGNEATALGLVAAARQAGKQLFYGSYPITPASSILEELAALAPLGVKTFQAEDEIAAMCSVVGAAFAGLCAATGTSGPGLDLKTEAIGLAVMTELPMVIVDVQRGGPSTGLPTKTEQSDLLQALFGRHGECPLPVLAARSPADCFAMAFEAFRIALEYMTPVILLSDGYLANGSEPWLVPRSADLPRIHIAHPDEPNVDGKFHPYQRDARGVRPWALPGTANLQHRIGGLEKQNGSGNVNYEAENHQLMTDLRAAKIAAIVETIPDLEVTGALDADLLVLGWGSSYGAITTAVENLAAQGRKVAQAHLRYLHPLPRNTGEVVRRYRRVLIPEMNRGQLLWKIRADFLVDARGLHKVAGKPFLISEIEQAICAALPEVQR